MIIAKDLCKRYEGSDRNAVDKIDLEVNDGEFLGIVGKSGSGKSTLLLMLGGIERPTSGTLSFEGKELSSASDDELSEFRSRKTGFVFQAFHLEPHFSVFDNVRIPLLINGTPYTEHDHLIEASLEKVDIFEKMRSKASNLSGGEKQRCAIARALVSDPQLILADEPCGNLDSENSKNIMELLKKINDEGKTVILVTHDIEATGYCSRVIKLKDGKIVDEIS